MVKDVSDAVGLVELQVPVEVGVVVSMDPCDVSEGMGARSFRVMSNPVNEIVENGSHEEMDCSEEDILGQLRQAEKRDGKDSRDGRHDKINRRGVIMKDWIKI